MNYFARLDESIVQEIVALPDGLAIADAFHPSLVFVPCASDTPIGSVYADGAFSVPDPTPPTIDVLRAYAAQKRWRVETGGITVAGASIDTSRDSQAMITGAYSYSQARPEMPVRFKAASGWVTLDNATVAAIATAVGDHVQASFGVESDLDDAMEAGTVTTFAEIDAAAWPANAEGA